MNATTIKLTLLICTRNRAEQLRKTLNEIKFIRSQHPWEIVLVDDGSRDHTQDVLEDFVEQSPVPTRHLIEKRPGGGRARNLGLGVARGELVAFTDDDCYLPPTHVEDVIAAFEKHPELGFLGGRVTLYDPDDITVTVRDSETPLWYPAKVVPEIGAIFGGNMAFRRVALEAIGGFDIHFGPGTKFRCEDCDVAARVSLAGWAGAYEPTIAVRHYHGRNEASAAALRRANAFTRGAYWAKFALRKDARPMILRQAYWWMRNDLSDPKRRSAILLELRGAWSYLWMSAEESLRSSVPQNQR